MDTISQHAERAGAVAVPPLAVDLCAGLGGWSEGLLAEGYDCIGVDIEAHVYGEHRYPGRLVIQDVLSLHGSQFRDAVLIVASPPCQFFSYTAMPWSKAKALAAKVRADPALLEKELALFNACFRIQREASASAGRHIPMVVENVRGAEPWVGRARWNFGSFYLWGDVPALMPPPSAKAVKVPGMDWSKYGQPGYKAVGFNVLANQRVRDEHIKLGGSWFHGYRQGQGPRNHGSKSKARKMASAMIAKIPLPLSRHIARSFLPQRSAEAA